MQMFEDPEIASLKPVEQSLRQAWKEAMAGETLPVDDLWTELPVNEEALDGMGRDEEAQGPAQQRSPKRRKFYRRTLCPYDLWRLADFSPV